MFDINEYREEKKEVKKQKFDFKLRKDNTLHSLREVNKFLSDFNKMIDYITLYKILK